MDPTLRSAHLRDLDPVALYRLLALRVDVFVVEQECPYPELDGLDLAPDCLQWWLEEDGEPVATLRTYADETGVMHLGRVATRADRRGRGYAATLVRAALAEVGGGPVLIGAQTYLEEWYAGFGFRRDGEDYVEDGIPHLPMRRDPLARS